MIVVRVIFLKNRVNREVFIKIIIVNAPAKRIVEPYYDLPNYPRTALAFLAGHLRKSLPNDQIEVLDANYDRLFKENSI